MNIIKKLKAPLTMTFIYLGIAFWLPDTAGKSISVVIDYAQEMIFIIPPVFILMGLLEVWIPKDKIQQWLGSNSGLKGILISFFMGTLPTGPLYVAFPLTASLLKKGASITNMVIFLGSWAALKIPQLLVEMKFLGGLFTLLRFILTLIVIIIIGLIMELFLKRIPDVTE